MTDSAIYEKIRSRLSNDFILTFVYNDITYKTKFSISNNDNVTIISHNKCINIVLENGEFRGFIEADSEMNQCFEPRLITNSRNKPREKRTTSGDVLQILKTKLALCFPTNIPITLFDDAKRKVETETDEPIYIYISPFNILRGDDAYYEKFGYVSDTINIIKKDIQSFLWKDIVDEGISIMHHYTNWKNGTEGVETKYGDNIKLIDIMKGITWDDEVNFLKEWKVPLSREILRFYVWAKNKDSNVLDNINIFTLNKDDPRWKASEKKLVFKSFEPVLSGGKRKTRRRKYTKKRRDFR